MDTHQRLGDWEADKVIGKGHPHVIVSPTERNPCSALLKKAERRMPQAMKDTLIELLKSLTVWIRTITADNGGKLSHHERIAKDLHADLYFAHPYSSWKQATNTNMNDPIRQHIPKKNNFINIIQQEIEAAIERHKN